AQRGSAFVPCPQRDLDRVFSLQFERTVNRDNTVSFLNLRLQIEPVQWRGSLAGCSVTAHQHLDGTLSLSYGPHGVGRYDAAGMPLAAKASTQLGRGRGSAPSPAPRRRRSQGNFAKRQALSAIVNDDVSWLVLPHPHSALSRRPVTILPRELQQAVFVTHHPVFTEHSFFLQPEHVVQLSRRGTLPMIVGFSGRRSRVVAIVLGDVMLLQISIGIVIVAYCRQPQLLDQPVLMGTVHALHPPLGLRRTGGDDADPSLAHICPNWCARLCPATDPARWSCAH